jgi:hypothetical protein
MTDPNAPTPAEQLARLWHEKEGWSRPWDELPKDLRDKETATASEVLAVILEGKIIEYDDPGDKLAMLLGKTEDGKIRVDFQKPLKWFAMPPDHAVSFALTILQHCGIPVQVNIAPAPGAPETGKPV